VEQKSVLRGNAPAKIDEKGRLKVPNGFRALMEAAHGRLLYVTSLTGESVRIYPLPVWEAIEAKLAAVPSSHPARARFFDRVNYFGQVAELDAQGRVGDARIVCFGVGPRPVRATAAERSLVGGAPSATALAEAGRLASASVEPSDDIHASGAYRKRLAGVLAARALATALESAAALAA